MMLNVFKSQGPLRVSLLLLCFCLRFPWFVFKVQLLATHMSAGRVTSSDKYEVAFLCFFSFLSAGSGLLLASSALLQVCLAGLDGQTGNLLACGHASLGA